MPARDDARIVHETMAAFLGDAAVTHLHDPDTSPWAGVSPDRNTTMQRLAGLRAVATASAGRAIVGSGIAWSRRSTPHDVLERLLPRAFRRPVEKAETDRILSSTPLFGTVATIAAAAHEREDGSGRQKG